jgi:hypothetical protein
MQKQEIMVTSYGEMSDMISCYAIFNGAEPLKKHKMSFDDAMKLR